MHGRICSQNRKGKTQSPRRKEQVRFVSRKQEKENDGVEQLLEWKEGGTGSIHNWALKFTKGGSWTESIDQQVVK